MKSKESEILWSLDNLEQVKIYSHQNSFYQDLDTKECLQDAIYKPNELIQRRDNQKKTKISQIKFKRVNFSKTKIKGISFHNCTFDQCLFITSEISGCEFHNCQFILTNTYKISISDTYIDPKSFKKCLRRDKHQNIGIHLYHMLHKNSRNTEQIAFSREAHFQFLKWERYQFSYEIKKQREEKDLLNLMKYCQKYSGRLVWEKVLGSGIRIRNLVFTSFVTLFFFTSINFIFREEFGLMHHNELIATVIDAFYFTVISLTTLGYGDIAPTTDCGKLIASFQSTLGFFLFAILASMFFRRISP